MIPFSLTYFTLVSFIHPVRATRVCRSPKTAGFAGPAAQDGRGDASRRVSPRKWRTEASPGRWRSRVTGATFVISAPAAASSRLSCSAGRAAVLPEVRDTFRPRTGYPERAIERP